MEEGYTRSKYQLWENLLNEQTALFRNTVAENEALRARLSEVERELSVWKVAFKVEEDDKVSLQKNVSKLERNICSLRDDNPLILCLVDGDGNIFAQDLIVSGQMGGRQAAMLLTQGLSDYMDSRLDPGLSGRGQVWLTVYCNKSGLLETLTNNNICTVEQFEAFFLGFNQASPLFSIVDVGYGKEASDAKIKEYLRVFTRFPQTSRVFFGGAHDNGYKTTLTYLENEGLLSKVVLLRGYKDLAIELKSLDLPILEIEGVFMTKKIPSNLYHKNIAPSLDSENFRRSSSRSSSTRRSLSPTKPSKNSGDKGPSHQPRRLDPSLPLNKQKPPPCNFYYLSNCKQEHRCKYGHDYDLSEADMLHMRANAKKSPCFQANNDKPCHEGDRCPLGHSCPYGPKCLFYEQGKCKFQGKDMHNWPPMSPRKKGKQRIHPEIVGSYPNIEREDDSYVLSSPPPALLSRIGATGPADDFISHFYEDTSYSQHNAFR